MLPTCGSSCLNNYLWTSLFTNWFCLDNHRGFNNQIKREMEESDFLMGKKLIYTFIGICNLPTFTAS
jgi:hypothetical protein